MKPVDAEEDEVNSHPVNKNAPEKIKSGFSFPYLFLPALFLRNQISGTIDNNDLAENKVFSRRFLYADLEVAFCPVDFTFGFFWCGVWRW